jgi:hypothetical protein
MFLSKLVVPSREEAEIIVINWFDRWKTLNIYLEINIFNKNEYSRSF